MIKKASLFLGFFSIVAVGQIHAQNKLDQAIQTLEDKYTQEKVYLLLDKSQYVTGDNIVFKSYVFEGYTRSTLSTTLFVELYDRDKKLLDKRTVLLKNGEGDGSIAVKDDLKEDVYYIRAYTPWMENFSQDFNYVRPIPIYNPTSAQRLTTASTSSWTINASPEGGNLINGISTKVAVRLLSDASTTNDWNGYVIDAAKPSEKLASFNALDQNVALFSFTPKMGAKYQVVVQDKKGNKQTADLPGVLPAGVSLVVTNDAKGINYTVKGINTTDGLKGYKIVGTIANHLAYRANVKNNSPEISSTIPSKINEENNGVLQLAVFDDKDNLVAQRLCFIKPKSINVGKPDLIDLSLTQKPRSFNSFEITPNENYSHYTVMVRDANDVSTNNDNILSSLWLTQDFKMPLQAPAQYFSGTSNADALDALMISEKWNRFNWNSVISGSVPSIKYPPQKYLSYKGKLAVNGRPLPNTIVNLVFKTEEGDTSFAQFTTDAAGFIYLNEVTIDKPITVYYYLNAEKGKESQSVPDNLTLILQPTVEPTVFTGNLPTTNYTLTSSKVALPPSVANAITNKQNKEVMHKDEIQIAAVNITAKKEDSKAKLDKELSSGMFNSINSTVFDFVNENQNAQSYSNIMQWLQGRVAGVTVQMDNSGNSVPYIRGSKAALYLDEIPTDASMFNGVSVSDIAMVKVIKGGGLVGDAIAVYTRRGNMGSANAGKEKAKDNKTQLIAYSQPYNFEQPDYSKDVYKKITNDTRELLYFNPEITEDSGLPARVKFFSNDQSKAYDVTIIGFDKNDKPLFYNQILK